MNRIHLTQVIDAPPNVIWRALSELDGLAAWQADEAAGVVAEGEIITLRWPALSVELELGVVELVPERRLILSAGNSELMLEVEPGRIELTHSGVGEGDEVEGVASSWRMSLGILAHYCQRHARRRRTVRWLIRTARTGVEAAHVFFTDARALSAWLGAGSDIGDTGSRFALDLTTGERMSGTVIANTPGRDVAISWEEDGGSVICLRTLPRPLSPDERWIALSWSRWSDTAPDQELLERLDAAHHRLVRALDTESSA